MNAVETTITFRDEEGRSAAEVGIDTLRRVADALGGASQAPGESRFANGLGGDDDFIEAPDLARVGASLVQDHFPDLEQFTIVYLWKREGGTSKGKPRLGQCQKPSGLLRYFAEADFVVWLAADHARAFQFGGREIEAALHHELCHAGVDENGAPVVLPHDVETFAAEIERYGLWKGDLRRVGQAVQLALSLDEGAGVGTEGAS